MESLTNKQRNPDYIFLILAGLVVFLGLVFLTSASSVLGWQKFHDSYYYLKHQIFYGLIPGLILFVVFSRIPYQNLRKLALPALIFSFILLVAVFIPGVGLNLGGARRWLNLVGFVFQPSEVVKLSLLLYLAAWLDTRGADTKSFKKGLLPFVLVAGVMLGLIVLQPDLGTMSVLAISAFVTYLVAGANISHLLLLASSGMAGLWFVVKYFSQSAKRLTIFLHPELDPQGIGYHINQALLAVGSGGFFGLGLGYSRQKYAYLPEVTGDSIFAVVAEELGFVLTLVFIILIGCFLWRGFRIAQRAPDNFGRYLAVGIVTWLSWQTCINIASMLNILPLTGVPLPFVSAGGTALVVCLSAVGILTNISRYTNKNNV